MTASEASQARDAQKEGKPLFLSLKKKQLEQAAFRGENTLVLESLQ